MKCIKYLYLWWEYNYIIHFGTCSYINFGQVGCSAIKDSYYTVTCTFGWSSLTKKDGPGSHWLDTWTCVILRFSFHNIFLVGLLWMVLLKKKIIELLLFCSCLVEKKIEPHALTGQIRTNRPGWQKPLS